MVVHAPGAYRSVIERDCDRSLSDDVALTDITPEAFAAHERDRRERVAALVEQRIAAGEPVIAQSMDLPRGLGAAFTRWPVDGRQHSYRVTADDVITVLPIESGTA
jgi:hypothetical protein